MACGSTKKEKEVVAALFEGATVIREEAEKEQ